MDQTLPRLNRELHDQWDLLRTRLPEVPPARYHEPSGLQGWRLADLIAHLGVALGSLAESQPDPDAEPLSLSEYLQGYGPTDALTQQASIEAADQAGDDPLATLDRAADAAFDGLQRLSHAGGAAVVQARGGALRLADLVRTRLIELVVHGYDLAPFLVPPAPVTGASRRVVAQVLLEIVEHRTGYDLDVADRAAWIRAATGRITWAEAISAGALRPEYLSDGTPDLSGALPLF